MKQPTFNGRKLLPLSVIDAAHAGDAEAIFEKLGVSSAVEAITKAIQLGYIPPL